MKINWGTAIVISFVLFAAFLTYFMIRSAQNPDTLVKEDYYEAELNYQAQIESKARAKKLGSLAFSMQNGQLNITFPAGFDGKSASGNIHFYKPDNAKIDTHYAVSPNEQNQQLVDISGLTRGLWYIKINATANHVSYYWEESLNL